MVDIENSNWNKRGNSHYKPLVRYFVSHYEPMVYFYVISSYCFPYLNQYGICHYSNMMIVMGIIFPIAHLALATTG